MANGEYWYGIFGSSAVRVVSVMVCTETKMQSLLKFCEDKGPEWIGDQLELGDKRHIGRVLVFHTDIMKDVYDIHSMNPIFRQMDPQTFVMKPIDLLPDQCKSWYGDMIPYYTGSYSGRMWSFRVAHLLEEAIGSYIVKTDWYKKNMGVIRKAVNKRKTVREVMEVNS